MALKVNKDVTLQGGINIVSGSICQVDIKTNHRKNSEDKLIQLITLSFYRDQAAYNSVEEMSKPKEFKEGRFNIELTTEEFNTINGQMINEKAKQYIVDNSDFVDADLEIVNV